MKTPGWRLALEVEGDCHASGPVTFGVPVPRGAVDVGDAFRLVRGEMQQPCQSEVVERWPDGSARWVLIDAVLPDSSTDSELWLETGQSPDSSRSTEAAVVRRTTAAIEVATKRWTAAFSTLPSETLLKVVADKRVICTGKLQLTDRRHQRRRVVFETAELECEGSQRTVVRLRGTTAQSLNVTARVSIAGSQPMVNVDITIHNPRRAVHRGGLWDLGDRGSVLFEDLSFILDAGGLEATEVHCRMSGSGETLTAKKAASIYQDSSGGANWNSPMHVSRQGRVPCRFRGYRMAIDTKIFNGLRAEPKISLRGGGGELHVTMPEFWQQFPSCLEATPGNVRVGLFPSEWDDFHELQGGERKSHRVQIGLLPAVSDEAAHDVWSEANRPLRPANTVLSRWGVLPDLRDVPTDALLRFEAYLEECLTALSANRERVDLYGWRNFGDVHADHEELHYHGEQPQISHYNNQFDMLQGFLLQYLRTGDRWWWDLGDALARHVIDIDLYHTSEDKAAYSGGLFWFTDHYLHAHTATHRTYSRHNRPANGPYGGGPNAQHNFTSGLLLYHRLTGSVPAREAVLQLADWVTAMDDGRRTVFGLLDEGPTGQATSTADPLYHGPGRGAGNSLNALLDAWQLSGDRAYLKQAEGVIRRCIHPHDDVDARDLLDVEHRWSYTVFLSALAKYLRLKAEDRTDAMYGYGRASLLRYAMWMLANERPYFDQVEKLEYPTEAWAAQEFRKANVLRLASAYAEEPAATRMFQRGEDLADRAWRDLLGFSTRTTARAFAIVMTEGLWDLRFRSGRPEAAPNGPLDAEFGAPAAFVPQKARVAMMLRSPKGLASACGRLLHPLRWRRNLEILRKAAVR